MIVGGCAACLQSCINIHILTFTILSPEFTFFERAPCPANFRLSFSETFSMSMMVYSVNCFEPMRPLKGDLKYVAALISATESEVFLSITLQPL